MDRVDWPALSREEKKKQLYLTQKDLLDKFLERNAITKAEYTKSLGDLTRKMGMDIALANNVRLIDGKEFAEMLLEAGLNQINM